MEPGSAATQLLLPWQHKASCFLLRISSSVSSAYIDSWLVSIVPVLFGGHFPGFVFSAALRTGTGTTSGSLCVQAPDRVSQMGGWMVSLLALFKPAISCVIPPPSRLPPALALLSLFLLAFFVLYFTSLLIWPTFVLSTESSAK